jgi:hypothetical protein
MRILELDDPRSSASARDATEVLEAGGLVLFRRRAFELSAEERSLLDPAVSNGRSKNISLDPSTGEVKGTDVDDARRRTLGGMIERFAATADSLLQDLTPGYQTGLQRRRTSFRPGAIAHRALSPRKDDRRLHVDAFPANPTHGRRILRVFANVNPRGEARTWHVGEDGFEPVARRFRRRLTARGRLSGLKASLGLTKGRQSAYDQVMLQLHDSAKLDDAFQREAPKRLIEFPAGSMWVVYTDSVMHAALSGQHAFEQTYLLPVASMLQPEASPLRTLERIVGRSLA